MLKCWWWGVSKIQIAQNISWNKEASFKCDYSSSNRKSFNPTCYTSPVKNETNPNSGAWNTSLSQCEDIVTIWGNWGDFFNVCNYLKNNKSWDINCSHDIIEYGDWRYVMNTYANDYDKLLACLKVKDKYWNDINFNYFNLIWSSQKEPKILDWLNIDQVSWKWGNWVNINSAAFFNWNICILMTSMVPWKEKFRFNLKFPNHKEEFPLVWDWNTSPGLVEH